MRWDENGECWISDNPDEMDGWEILGKETWKPGVMRYHIRKGHEFRIVYYREERAMKLLYGPVVEIHHRDGHMFTTSKVLHLMDDGSVKDSHATPEQIQRAVEITSAWSTSPYFYKATVDYSTHEITIEMFDAVSQRPRHPLIADAFKFEFNGPPLFLMKMKFHD